MPSLVRHFLGLTALIASLLPALAAGDPPGRVGRLAQIQGDVIFRSDRQDPGSPASINWPISSGAIIDTERRSRAEVWVGSTAYRLDSNSRAEFVTVNDQIVDLLLASGTLAVTIRDRDQADDLQINTPGGRVRFPGPGRFRIEVRHDQTSVAAQAGSAEILTGERSVSLRPGEIATFGTRGLLGIDAAPYGDDFDAWVSAQDARERSNAARRYISPQMTGYQDLDTYGDWSSVPEYGTVWYPRSVAADWAPYRDGRWAWVEPWGWTWVDAAPWGFAPFHYGRWVQVGGRWGWAPGTYAARPVYAPALVGWAGDPGRSVRFGYAAGPAVGWFPLAPREVYVPGYRTSPTYVRQINVTHVQDHAHIDRALHPDYRPRYTYQGQPQAITKAPNNNLQGGGPVDYRNARPHDRNAPEQAPGGARQGPMEPYRQPQAGRPPAEHMQQPAIVTPQASQGGRREMTTQPGHPPEYRGRLPDASGAPGTREFSRPQPGTPRADDRPPQAMPAPAARDERYRQAPPAIREIQSPAAVQNEQTVNAHREPPRYREPFQARQPQPERVAPMQREAPRAVPAQPPFQAQPQAQPQRQPQPPAPPMREMPRNEQRPPAQGDQNRHGHAPDDRRGDRGQR